MINMHPATAKLAHMLIDVPATIGCPMLLKCMVLPVLIAIMLSLTKLLS